MRRFLPLLLLMVLCCCTKNEVKLTFELPKDVNEPCRILYYASGKKVGVIRETVAEIQEGKGEVKLPLQYPALVYLFSPSGRMPVAVIYAERGNNIEIRGKNGNIEEWEITGNATTEELNKWRIENIELIRGGEVSAEKVNAAVEKYVKAHPDSKASAIMLYCYYKRRGHEKEFYALQSTLGKKVTGDDKLMAALSMGDLITELPDSPTVPKQIVLTGEEGFADTLFLGKGQGTLLLFRNSQDPGVSADSLKAIAERKKKQTLAEIYMDTDSLSWTRHLRQDTLPEVKRMWMPLGVADTVAIAMGVRRVPYFIVIGPKGKELYRGDDWKEAAGKLESLK